MIFKVFFSFVIFKLFCWISNLTTDYSNRKLKLIWNDMKATPTFCISCPHLLVMYLYYCFFVFQFMIVIVRIILINFVIIFVLRKICISYPRMRSAKWQIFYEFLMFSNLFHKPLDEWNNDKIWETSKVFANITQKLTCDNYYH